MEEDERFRCRAWLVPEYGWQSTTGRMPDGRCHSARRWRRLCGTPAKSGSRGEKVLPGTPHVYFVGEGAERFAQEHGIPLCSNDELVRPAGGRTLAGSRAARLSANAGRVWPDAPLAPTPIGAVALDRQGNIAAATSTGGTLNKAPGRVGDSSLIGCGLHGQLERSGFHDGMGEPMIELVLSKWTADRVEEDQPQEAAQRALSAYMKKRLSGHGGMIVVDAKGRSELRTIHRAWRGRCRSIGKSSSGIGSEALNDASLNLPLALIPAADVKPDSSSHDFRHRRRCFLTVSHARQARNRAIGNAGRRAASRAELVSPGAQS